MPTNTKPTHTPGPWAVDSSGREIARPEHMLHGTVGCTAHPAHRIAQAQRPEDARLIAAAPDLLVSLRAMMEGHRTGENVTPAEWDAALAAIAKAEG